MRLLCQEEFYESENIFSAYVFCIPRRPVPGMRKTQKRKNRAAAGPVNAALDYLPEMWYNCL